VFGSVARGMDTAQSDLDLLVDTTDETTLFDIACLKLQLKQLMGCEVDVLTPMAIAPAMRENIYAQCIAL
jgi:predicted nucleotidyltransferase